MKTLPLALTFAACAVLVTGCNSTSSRYAASSNGDEYVYVIDWDKVNQVEKASATGNANVDTIWVNYPMKRVKKSELASK